MRSSRRKFLATVPAAVASAAAADVWAQRGPQGPVTTDIVKAVETIDGVKFSSDEETAAAAGANGNLNSFNRLRQTTIPQDTEPAKLEPVDLPDGMLAAAQPLSFILEVEAAAAFDDITRSGEVNQLSAGTSKSTWPNTFRQGRLVPAVEYIRAMRARTILMRLADDFFSKYDAVLEPGTAGTLALTNLTGHPAMALKCGFTAAPGYASGQPRVLMITGRLYEEATICRIALAYEQATAWKDRHPTLA
jgi:hypothetical protein